MRRALILIISLSLLSFGCGFWLDHLRFRTADEYLQQAEAIRLLAQKERWQEALKQERLVCAHWEQDERWLKCLIEHHHSRAVDAAFLQLDTALVNQWMDEALPALDELHMALTEIREDHLPALNHIL